MKSKNICKFITSGGEERIVTASFVYESDHEAMKKSTRLTQHVAFLVSGGEGHFIFGGTSFPVKKGCLIFGFEGEEKASALGDGFEYMYISFSGGRANELFSRFGISEKKRISEGFEGLIPFWRDNLSRATDENIDLVSESVLMYTFSRLTEQKKQNTEIVTKLVRLIEEDFSDPYLSLSSLSDELGYNPKYLSHSFKEKMGMGFSQYLRTVRIKHAVFLMEHGVDSVKNVAFLCGFTDPLYFSSVFKDSLGTSPKEYIAQLRKSDAE